MQNKSEQSTTLEPMSDPSLYQCFQKLKQQNEYLKKALQTAQSLIKNYQQENNRLEIQIKILQCKLKKSIHKNQSINSQTSIQCLKQSRMSSDKKCKVGDKNQMGSQRKMEGKDLQIEELNGKIKKLVSIQERYEEKITEMEQKIVLLQRNRQDNKINKQSYALTIGQTYFSTVVRESHKKTKNLAELRALHMKLKTKEAEDDSSVEKQDKMKMGKGLVQRVFSKQKISSNNGNSSKKKMDHHKIYEIKRKC